MGDKKQRKPLKSLIPRPLLPNLGAGEPEPKAESLILKKSSTCGVDAVGFPDHAINPSRGDPKTGFSAAPSSAARASAQAWERAGRCPEHVEGVRAFNVSRLKMVPSPGVSGWRNSRLELSP